MCIDPGYESHVVLEQLKGQVLVSNAQNFPLVSFRQLGVQSLLVCKAELQIQLRCSASSGLLCALQQQLVYYNVIYLCKNWALTAIFTM